MRVRVVSSRSLESSPDRTPSGLIPSPMPETPQRTSSASTSSTPEIPARLAGRWVGHALAQLSLSPREARPVVGAKRRAARSLPTGPRVGAAKHAARSASARGPEAGRRGWIRAADLSARAEVEAEAVRFARLVLGSPRRTFTRAQIRRAVERTEAAMLPGRSRATLWQEPAPGARVPRNLRPAGTMRDERLPPDLAAYLARQGVPFDPDANPRRRRRLGARDAGRLAPAYVFRVNGVRAEAAERIVSGLHAEAAAVRRTRFWETIFPRVAVAGRGGSRSARGSPLVSSPSSSSSGSASSSRSFAPAIGHALLDHARLHGAAVAMLYLPVPGGGADDLHAVVLSLVPSPRRAPSLAIHLPKANLFTVTVYDPNGAATYDRGALDRFMEEEVAAAQPGVRLRLRPCGGPELRRLRVQYRREGSCVAGALALMLRVAARRGNRAGPCTRPFQELQREDAILAAQLVTWYGRFLHER
jgi:hypothetical protein